MLWRYFIGAFQASQIITAADSFMHRLAFELTGIYLRVRTADPSRSRQKSYSVLSQMAPNIASKTFA